MQVEIYDERELNPETLAREPDAEAMAIIEELGLSAQTNDGGARVCYPRPTADQAFIIGVLFPTETTLDRYDAGGIPLRVLKEIRSYRAENPGHTLVIRHAPPATVKDPILLAKDGGQSWSSDVGRTRMIARWGDALEPWDLLMEKALKVASEKAAESLRKIIRRAQGLLDGIEAGEPWREANLPSLHLPFSID